MYAYDSGIATVKRRPGIHPCALTMDHIGRDTMQKTHHAATVAKVEGDMPHATPWQVVQTYPSLLARVLTLNGSLAGHQV